MSIRIGGYATAKSIEGMDLEDEQALPECDMLTETPLKLIAQDPITIQRVKECVYSAIMDGYTHVVYDFIRNGCSQLTKADICGFKGFDMEQLWAEYSSGD